jgi:hypothetical protein
MMRGLAGLLLLLVCGTGAAAESWHLEFAHAASVQQLLTLAPPPAGVPGLHIEGHGQDYVLRSADLARRADAEQLARQLRTRRGPVPRIVASSGAQRELLQWHSQSQAALLPSAPVAAPSAARGRALAEPAAGAPVPASLPPPPVAESVLWDLLAHARLADFDRARRDYPQRLLPPRLLALRAELEVDAVLDGGDVTALRTLLRQRPDALSCRRLDRVGRAAMQLEQAADPDAALALYRSVLAACRSGRDRVSALSQAAGLLDEDSTEALIAREARIGQRDRASEARFQTLRYQRAMSRLGRLDPDSDEAASALAAVAGAIVQRHDASAAELGGWIRLRHGDWEGARRGFAQALDWQPRRIDARYGLALVAFRLGQLDAAERLAVAPGLGGQARARALLADIALQRAVQANRARRFADSQRQLDRAESLGADPGPLRALRAWNRYGLHDYAGAAEGFAGVYREAGDLDSARGRVLSLLALGRRDELGRETAGRHDTLADEFQARETVRLAGRELYLAAQTAASGLGDRPARVDAVAPDTVGSNSLASGLAVSSASGEAGQSRLTSWSLPLGAEFIDGAHYLDVQYRTLYLDAGRSAPQAAVGSPLAGQGFVTNTASGSAVLQRVAARWGVEGWREWTFGVAATQGGVESTGFEGFVRLRQQTDNGHVQLLVQRRAVDESLLSWRGMSDPAHPGAHWGAVTRNGGTASLYEALGERWGLSLAAGAESLNGDNVRTNQAWHLDLALGVDLNAAGYRYVTLGPQLDVESYRYNLSHYTWGQGGYYSPQSHLFAGGGVQWQSLEGGSRLWRGSLAIGYSQDRQAEVVYLPLSEESGQQRFAASTNVGPAARLQLGGALSLAPHWQLAGTAAAAVSPGNSRQWQALISVRYFFEARGGVSSRDVPADDSSFNAVSFR